MWEGLPVDEVEFGRYRLIALIGEGGMGEVWRAQDTVTDRVVAIKLLPAKLSKDEDFEQRFRRELDAAARLNTPHVVPIHDYGEIDGRLFVSMRLIEGRDLATVLAEGPLDPARAVRIIGQVAEALHAAHEVGLIHRDIKPSNVLLDEDDFAYLIDFGIARAADDTRMAKSGNMIGAFAYIAPERLDGRGDEDARVDIYSLACVLYECLTGEPPFGGDTMERLVAAHLNAPPPRPSITRPGVPAQVDEVIAMGMAKEPDQRYATTVELANAAHDAVTAPLALSAQNEGTPAASAAKSSQTTPATERAAQQPAADPVPPETPTPPRQSWRLPRGRAGLIAATIAVLAVLVAGFIIFRPQQPSRPASQVPTAQPAAPLSPIPVTPPPPVTAAALEGLLLSPDQINTVMGATALTVQQTSTDKMDDNFLVVEKGCQPVGGNLLAAVYAGSGWKASREQVLEDPLVDWNQHPQPGQWVRGQFAHNADQGVVSFPSAHDAGAFFTASAQQWAACSNRQYTLTQAGYPDAVFTVGPVLNTNGTLSATVTLGGNWLWQSCQRALTVANNVVIDVKACTKNQSDPQSDAAVSIAHQIAAKVPTT